MARSVRCRDGCFGVGPTPTRRDLTRPDPRRVARGRRWCTYRPRPRLPAMTAPRRACNAARPSSRDSSYATTAPSAAWPSASAAGWCSPRPEDWPRGRGPSTGGAGHPRPSFPGRHSRSRGRRPRGPGGRNLARCRQSMERWVRLASRCGRHRRTRACDRRPVQSRGGGACRPAGGTAARSGLRVRRGLATEDGQAGDQSDPPRVSHRCLLPFPFPTMSSGETSPARCVQSCDADGSPVVPYRLSGLTSGAQ